MVYITTICASPHGENSSSFYLLSRVIEGIVSLEEDCIVKHFFLYENLIDSCYGHYTLSKEDCNTKTCIRSSRGNLEEIFSVLKESHILLIGSPVYWYGMPGILKNLLDRMTSLEQERKALKGKGCGIVVSYQEEGAIQVVKDLMIVLNEMGFWFPPFSFLYAREEELYGEDIRAGAYQLGRNLLLFYRALKEVPAQEWWEREAVD